MQPFVLFSLSTFQQSPFAFIYSDSPGNHYLASFTLMMVIRSVAMQWQLKNVHIRRKTWTTTNDALTTSVNRVTYLLFDEFVLHVVCMSIYFVIKGLRRHALPIPQANIGQKSKQLQLLNPKCYIAILLVTRWTANKTRLNNHPNNRRTIDHVQNQLGIKALTCILLVRFFFIHLVIEHRFCSFLHAFFNSPPLCWICVCIRIQIFFFIFIIVYRCCSRNKTEQNKRATEGKNHTHKINDDKWRGGYSTG